MPLIAIHSPATGFIPYPSKISDTFSGSLSYLDYRPGRYSYTSATARSNIQSPRFDA